MRLHVVRLLLPLLLVAAPQATRLLSSESQAGRQALRVKPARASKAPLGRRKLNPSFRFTRGKTVPVAFFDADSTLRISKSGSPSANAPEDVRLLPGVARRIKQLNKRGYLVVIVSNQAGIPRFVSLADADAALQTTASLINKRGGRIDYYDFAENRDDSRKPGTGMATRLDEMLKSEYGVSIDLSRSFMVGDSAFKQAKNGEPGDIRPDGRAGSDFSNSDRLFAENLGITFYRAPEYFDRSNNRLKKDRRASVIRSGP